MMLRPTTTEITRRREPVTHDTFIDGLSPAEKHAMKRCERVRPPAVVAVDVWALEDGPLL